MPTRRRTWDAHCIHSLYRHLSTCVGSQDFALIPRLWNFNFLLGLRSPLYMLQRKRYRSWKLNNLRSYLYGPRTTEHIAELLWSFRIGKQTGFQLLKYCYLCEGYVFRQIYSRRDQRVGFRSILALRQGCKCGWGMTCVSVKDREPVL